MSGKSGWHLSGKSGWHLSGESSAGSDQRGPEAAEAAGGTGTVVDGVRVTHASPAVMATITIRGPG